MSSILRLWTEYHPLTMVKNKTSHMWNLLNSKLRNGVTLRQTIFIVAVLVITIFMTYPLGTSIKAAIFIDFNRHVPSTSIYMKLNSTPADYIDMIYSYSKAEYLNKTEKRSKDVIAMLVASFSGDIRRAFNPYPRLRGKVVLLGERFLDNCSTDLIIFHTGYPFREDLIPILDVSCRPVTFVNVDHIFYKFSPNFDPHIRDPTWTQKGKWNYHHMCYFWFKQVFELKIIQQYRYMMRLDDDSEMLGKWPNIFNIMEQRYAIYFANTRVVDFEYIVPDTKLVRNLTIDFVKKRKIAIQNPNLFADVFNHSIETPSFWNNIEIVDISFMRRPEVLDFARFVDESRGVFLYRWGDGPLRYITLAMFANASQILHRGDLRLDYCHPC